jgi:hypothetical protein
MIGNHYGTTRAWASTAQLSRYFDSDDREKIRVYINDDFLARPREIVQDIFAFIGVDPNFAPDISAKYNESLMPRSRQLHNIMTRQNPIRSALRATIPGGVRSRVKRFIMERNLTRMRLDPEMRRELTDAFREDIGLTERLIDRDLSHWLETAPTPGAYAP